MKIEIWSGRQGCGMGICTVGRYYLGHKIMQDMDYKNLKLYPVECWKCIEMNNLERINAN